MLFIITGLMASGKSTVAEALARRLPRAVHLRGDLFRRMIVSGRAEMGPAPSQEALDQLQLRYHLSAMVAIQYLKAGFDVVLQDNYYGQHWADMLDKLSGWQPKAFVLDPGLQVIQVGTVQDGGNAPLIRLGLHGGKQLSLAPETAVVRIEPDLFVQWDFQHGMANPNGFRNPACLTNFLLRHIGR